MPPTVPFTPPPGLEFPQYDCLPGWPVIADIAGGSPEDRLQTAPQELPAPPPLSTRRLALCDSPSDAPDGLVKEGGGFLPTTSA